MRHTVQTSRRVLAITAWLTLLLVILAGILSIPFVAEIVTTASEASVVSWFGNVILAAAIVILPAVWISAVVHAASIPRPPIPRSLLLVGLVVSNFVGSMFYYFVYVHWTGEPHDVP